MAQGLRDLIGRAMIDAEFLADLQKQPDTLLAQYDLTEAERATVRQALARLASAPAGQRGHAFRNALIRRVAT